MALSPDRPVAPPAGHEPSDTGGRARHPDTSGFVDADGGQIAWESYGTGDPPIVFVPPWQIVHSRIWKAQIPDFARRHRVVCWDARGNGRSDRPQDPLAHTARARAANLVRVMDAAGLPSAVLVGLSSAATALVVVAAEHPDRVSGLVFVCPATPLGEPSRSTGGDFEAELDSDEGWNKRNIYYWRRDYRGYLDQFFAEAFPEPHSTKQTDDAVAYGLDTDPESLAATVRAPATLDRDTYVAMCRAIRQPTLVIQGTDERISHVSQADGLVAAIPSASLVLLEGSGHIPNARDPVAVNMLIREFIASLLDDAPSAVPPTRRWTRSLRRPKRALYLSSPIGLGHAQRDVAVAAELRTLQPDLEIDWLAQHPVTAVLESRGERIHPLSADLANESAHIAAESSDHDLNAFQAIRRMDEILIANFMVFHDTVAEGEYDLVVGDEAWDVDHFFHENPEIKRTAFAWMTDFVGWLPMPEGGEREAYLTADYNAEMIEHVERFPRIRDRAIFVGDPEDIVPDMFGPGLPSIREWTERHFEFAGYVTGFDPRPFAERREELRRQLGYRDDERVVIVTVGGSGVGEALLRRVVAAYPAAARRVPGLRMVAVAGPRIEPAAIGAPPGVQVRGFVPRLYEHLAVCDLAVVQGGLTTTMELTAAGRPFIYFPLRNHFEQNRHVRHRLERYGAGRCLDWATSTPDSIAEAIALEIDRVPAYLPVASHGARRAAELIAEVL